MIRLAAIKVPLAKGIRLLLAPASESRPEESMAPLPFLPLGWEAKLGNSASPIIYYPKAPPDGMNPLALVEIASFRWELQIDPLISVDQLSLHSSLSGSTVKNQWREIRSENRIYGDFRFTVYLGSAWIELLQQGNPKGSRLRFEVITEKIDYAKEYHAMVEDIGSRCSQLLLDWGAPTTVNIASDPSKTVQTLLEQFLFLRHVLGPERLDLYLETLSRRPHSALHRERVWQPAAFASPNAFVRDPLRYGRRWEEAPDIEVMISGFTAQEILTERKYDSFDTPPNRFVKFALQTFRGVCEEVINSRVQNPDTGKILELNQERGAAWQEAVQMRDTLDACLAAPLFAEIGQLNRVPIESQALQKREGYREILHAWLMLEAAAQIDWPGRNDVYDGTNRDVATLYEFWLYFVLIDLFQKRLGMVWLRDESVTDAGPLPFCCKSSDGGMRINLKRGVESFCRFRWEHEGRSLLIHFFYNRRFGEQPTILEDGSYSKSFRPDYTVVVLPAEYESKGRRKAEESAEATGTISYLHFDAKYRIDKLKDLFGVADETDIDRQEAKTTGTVKNADLYKMHTYNEAIRRTVGSYVLYPGNDAQPVYQDSGNNRNIYRRYHEILPGIGAFALKPKASNGNHDALGVECLEHFFHDFLTHQLNKFTQSHRVNFWTHQAIREAPDKFDNWPAEPGEALAAYRRKPPADTVVLISQYRNWRIARLGRRKELAFLHAISSIGRPTRLDPITLTADFFLPYTRQKRSRTFHWLGWYASILRSELISRATLISEHLDDEAILGSDTQYYYLLRLGKPAPIDRRRLLSVEALVERKGYPVTKQWTDLYGSHK